MTKKRIGTIYGSPIIEGDKNLKTSNEIHVSELGGGEGNTSGIEDKRYYMGDVLDSSFILQEFLPCFTKVISNYDSRITSAVELFSGGATSFHPVAVELDFNYFMDFLAPNNKYFRGTLNQYLEFVLNNTGPDEAEAIKQFYSLPTITKEEFYALSKVEPMNK